MFDMIKLEASSVVKTSDAYVQMSKDIQKNLPMIQEASSHFGKTQSQFMDNFLTLSHPTPLRNARQALAELNKSIAALKEAQYKLSKKKLLIKRLEKDLSVETDDIKKEELQLEIDYESSNIATTMLYVEGAVRSVTNYTEQYKQIMKSAGYDEMSEADFEKEEERYHIMKAFDQAICAARAHGGLIDEGNHIYLSQIGVNGQMAQHFLNKFFEQERLVILNGGGLTSGFQRAFLKNMADHFAGCSNQMAEAKGMQATSPSALLTKEPETKLYQIRGNT